MVTTTRAAPTSAGSAVTSTSATASELRVVRHRPLPGVQVLEERTRSPAAHRVVAGLDLDDVGARVGEQLGAVRPGDARGPVEHPHAGERTDSHHRGLSARGR